MGLRCPRRSEQHMGERFAGGVRRLGADGSTMVEYSILLGLIAVVCVVVVGALGADVFDLFDRTEQLFDPLP
jgi:Flp pilus assembly pilin Flp